MGGRSWKKVCLWALLAYGFSVNVAAKEDVSFVSRGDSAEKKVTFSEHSHLYKIKRVSSTYPIKIKMKGRSLLVTSQHVQMLPIYKDNGVCYGLFRFNKGTNWISGLPKGTYIINNAKITVS